MSWNSKLDLIHSIKINRWLNFSPGVPIVFFCIRAGAARVGLDDFTETVILQNCTTHALVRMRYA